MAKQVLIEGSGQVARGTGRTAAKWMVGAFDGLGRAIVWIGDRARNAGGREGKRKQLNLVETLSLGNRRQLLLVVCGNQSYLVGAGADNVGSIFAIQSEVLPNAVAGAQAATPVHSGYRREKGPELVRPKMRGGAPETERGTGVWQ